MEKIIEIDGKKVLFKSTGSLPLRYKMQFRRDFFADYGSLLSQDGTLSETNLQIMCYMAWTLAKTADSNLYPFEEWFDSFNNNSFFKALPQIKTLLKESFKTINDKTLNDKTLNDDDNSEPASVEKYILVLGSIGLSVADLDMVDIGDAFDLIHEFRYQREDTHLVYATQKDFDNF